MKDTLESLKINAINHIDQTTSTVELEMIRVQYMGKKGELTQVLKQMGKLSPEERPLMGKLANVVRDAIEQALNNKKEQLELAQYEEKIKAEKIDVTANLKKIQIGHRHPLMQTKNQLEQLFQSMGFSIVDGPEIETVDNNFNFLNTPLNHPSRDMTDTFYISEEHLLRTQTSPVQIRHMKSHKPPIRIISAGRTFRYDDVDDTHSPMFYQMEGLVVDEGVSMANLIDTLNQFIKELFGNDMKTRYRPHYFPFTEPSAEIDVSCFHCGGKGCSKCNYTGWSMELLGCGMVHPNVLEACGIDSEKYTGFAFGMGVDRITMVKYGINNIRLLYENDCRFLEQF